MYTNRDHLKSLVTRLQRCSLTLMGRADSTDACISDVIDLATAALEDVLVADREDHPTEGTREWVSSLDEHVKVSHKFLLGWCAPRDLYDVITDLKYDTGWYICDENVTQLVEGTRTWAIEQTEPVCHPNYGDGKQTKVDNPHQFPHPNYDTGWSLWAREPGWYSAKRKPHYMATPWYFNGVVWDAGSFKTMSKTEEFHWIGKIRIELETPNDRP